LQQDISFRFDFIVRLINTAISLAAGIGAIAIIFSKTHSVNGWDFYSTMAVTGMFMFIQSLKNLFIGPSLDSIAGLGGELWTGGFDFTLLKPVPTQLYISIRNWAPLTLIDLVISLIVIIYSFVHVYSDFSINSLLIFIIAIFSSLIILYSILLILSSLAFWYLGTPVLWIFNSVMETGRYPVRVYPFVFRFILTWIIPVGLIVSIPAEALMAKADVHEVLFGLVFGIVSYIAAVLFFKLSIKKYSSASS